MKPKQFGQKKKKRLPTIHFLLNQTNQTNQTNNQTTNQTSQFKHNQHTTAMLTNVASGEEDNNS
jgi:hypothetical protein